MVSGASQAGNNNLFLSSPLGGGGGGGGESRTLGGHATHHRHRHPFEDADNNNNTKRSPRQFDGGVMDYDEDISSTIKKIKESFNQYNGYFMLKISCLLVSKIAQISFLDRSVLAIKSGRKPALFFTFGSAPLSNKNFTINKLSFQTAICKRESPKWR